MPMKLTGSCHCTAITFTLETHTPVPYQLCACTICRKVGGYSGSVNLGGIASTLKIHTGESLIKKYTPKTYTSLRSFCSTCASMLWLWDPHWPELIHPFATAIDTPLPIAEEMVCIMAGSKPEWVRWPEGKKSVHEEYGGQSLEEWHRGRGLWVE